jgi:hypothetical protein
MGLAGARRKTVLVFVATCTTCSAALVLDAAPAHAGKNDLELLNLCDRAAGSRCTWLGESSGRTVVNLDTEAATRYRSLMSELGVAIAPALRTPADTLGFSGFQFSAELGMTQISRDKPFWNGVAGVEASNPSFRRPDAWLTTAGAFVRKGMWFPVPAVEWGAGAMNILGSSMWAVQGYFKLALHEGFHRWVLPSLSIRGAASQLVGTDQVSLTVGSLDIVISKAFSIAGTARIEPFAGWNALFIDPRSGVIDATPGCDAVQLSQATTPQLVQALPAACPTSQAGTFGDLGANFTFPDQKVITRYRYFVGIKLKLAVLFLVAEAALIPAGHTRDTSRGGIAARDTSGTQRSVSVSGGFDF